jgi:hypothetical protein
MRYAESKDKLSGQRRGAAAMADGERADRISEGVLIVLVTAWAYLTAFAYEAGYLRYFGVPLELIEVNLRGLLLASAAL